MLWKMGIYRYFLWIYPWKMVDLSMAMLVYQRVEMVILWFYAPWLPIRNGNRNGLQSAYHFLNIKSMDRKTYWKMILNADWMVVLSEVPLTLLQNKNLPRWGTGISTGQRYSSYRHGLYIQKTNRTEICSRSFNNGFYVLVRSGKIYLALESS